MDIATLAMKIDTSDVERADSALDRLGDKGAKAEQAAKSVGDAYQQTGSKLGAAASAAIEAGEAFSRGANSARSQARELADLIAKIDPTTAAMKRLGDQQEQLSRFNLTGTLDGEQYKRLNAMLDEQRTALARSGDAMKLAGISAGQYAQAMRMLPMQLTDVATSLASGMPLWMVAIQQGGQVKDSFGGIGNAARGVAAAIGPMGLAVGGAAVGLSLLGGAALSAISEVNDLNKALIATGGAAGIPVDAIRAMGEELAGGRYFSQAGDALLAIVQSGKLAGNEMKAVAAAAVQMSVATGDGADQIAKKLIGAKDNVSKLAAEYNAQYHIMSAGTYAQIAALDGQGRKMDALKLLSETLSSEMAARNEKISDSTRGIASAWDDAKEAFSRYWEELKKGITADPETRRLQDLQLLVEEEKSRWWFSEKSKNSAISGLQAEIDKIQQRQSAKAEEARKDAENQAKQQAGIEAISELNRQQDQLEKLRGKAGNEHEQEAIRWVEAHAAATQEDKDRVIARGKALDEQEAANKREAESTRNATSETKKHAEALKDFLAHTSISTAATEAMAKAYFSGSNSIRELNLQQKVEQELLKTGAGAREAVTRAMTEQQNAIDRLDIGKRYADLKLDTDQLHAQAVATLAGTDALQAFNVQKAMAAALAGKNADALGAESQQLLEQIKLNQEAAKQVEMANRANSIMDRLYPQQKLLREYTEDQKALGEAMAIDKEHADQWRAALERLGAEYEANKKAGTAWGQWTASALERVDSAFADAWKNIGGGFKSFRTSLTDAFRQMLAELAHMAITKPIVLSIGAALGIGGSQQALANGGSGIWGMLSGSGSSSGGLGSLLSYGQSAYNVLTGVGHAALAGYQSGGVMGGLSGIGSYYGNMLSNAYSSVAGWFGAGSGAAASSAASAAGSTGFGYGSSLVNGGIGSASYAGSAASSVSSLSSSLSTVGTGLAAVGSALAIYNSYQQQGLKGALVTGGATALGAVFGGPIGAAIGSAVGNFLSGKLFGGSWQTKDYGLALDVSAGDFGAQSYEYQKKKGGLFGSNKSRTRYSDLPADTLSGLEQTWATTESGVAGLYEQLGLHIQAGTLDGLQIARAQISTKGKSEEEIQKAVTDWFTKAGESLNTYLNQAFGTGLSYDLAGMTAFVQNLQSVNAMLTNLNVGLFDASVSGGKMAENLSALAGGFDALSSSVATYYDQFFSAGEKQQDTLDNVTKAFADSSLTLPKTRDGYRAMVEAIDLTTESGRQLFDSLMKMAGQADAYYDVLEGRSAVVLANIQSYYDKFTTEAQKQNDTLLGVSAQFQALGLALPSTRDGFVALVGGLDQATESGRAMFETLMASAGAADSYYSILEQRVSGIAGATTSAAQGALSALSGAINAEKQRLSDSYNARVASLNDMAGTASSAISSLTSVGSSLDSALKQLAGSSGQATAILHEQAVATLRSALSFAKAGGSLSGFAGLQDAIDSATSIGSGNYSTLADMQREQGRTANLLAQLQGVNGAQLTAEQRILDGLQGQIDLAKESYDLQSSGLDAQLTAAQSQLDALLGIDSGVKSVADALALFAGSMQQAQALQNANSSITSVTDLAGVKRQVASDGTILDQNGQSMGLKVIGNQVVGTESWNSSWKMDVGQNGQLSWSSGQQQNIEAWAKAQGIPGFATGGDFGGGLGMFGERGPELAVTGPMRVFNASQTADMLGGSTSTATEVRGLRADMAQVFDALRAIAKHTMQTAKRVESLERWDYDGMPAVRA